MRDAPISPEIQVPLIILGIEPFLNYPRYQLILTLYPLPSSNYFPYPFRSKEIST